MKVSLGESYRIRVDEGLFLLQEKKETESEKDCWTNLGCFSTLKGLANFVSHLELKKCDVDNLGHLCDVFDKRMKDLSLNIKKEVEEN